MCGIAGILDFSGAPVGREPLIRMCRAMAHRGPDDEGFHWEDGIGLGHRRLSIIDLSTGHQPFANKDQTLWITYNGEIYNYVELREELKGLGYDFVSSSDTEVILHAYEQFGENCLQYLRGMFAFAIWDGREKQLFLARDRVGKKPLLYSVSEDRFVFASEFQALLESGEVKRSLDPQALDLYLSYSYIPAPWSIYKDIKKLPPGHCLIVKNRNVQLKQYWTLEYGPKYSFRREEEIYDRFREIFNESVRIRMRSDVPFGAFLSGGIDSSSVVAVMSQFSTLPVRTFSIGFESKSFSELEYARLVAEAIGTEHHEFVVKPDAVSDLPHLVRHYGEPYGDSSSLPTFYLSKLTRGHVTVALNGDGGDEAFAGYERYRANWFANLYCQMPALGRSVMGKVMDWVLPDSLDPQNRVRQVKRFLQAAGLPQEERYAGWLSVFSPDQKRALYTGAFQELLRESYGGQWLQDLYRERANLGILDASLATDVASYLPYDLLVKMDIASMANSLETRSPYLDHCLMEFAARLPKLFKLRGLTLKYLLKKVFRKALPREVLYRRKMGFGLPVGIWFREGWKEFVRELLLSPRSFNRGYFRPHELKRFVEDHIEGRKDYSLQVWSLMTLEIWHRECMDRPASEVRLEGLSSRSMDTARWLRV